MKRTISIIVLIILTVGMVLAFYLFRPYDDVGHTEAFVESNVGDLVEEFLTDPAGANQKYLASDGGSRIITLRGQIKKVFQSQDGRPVVILRGHREPAGFQCMFQRPQEPLQLVPRDSIMVKGVLRAGPSYEEDLGMHENGYLEDCILLE